MESFKFNPLIFILIICTIIRFSMLLTYVFHIVNFFYAKVTNIEWGNSIFIMLKMLSFALRVLYFQVCMLHCYMVNKKLHISK